MTHDETLPITRPESVSGAASGKRGTGTYSFYRDPQDVRTVIQLARSGIVLSLLLLISVAGNFYQYHRRPDRIVVDKSSGRVVEINDRDFGETEAVQLGPEHLTDADKKYIASEFIRSLYQIDLTFSFSPARRITEPASHRTEAAPCITEYRHVYPWIS